MTQNPTQNLPVTIHRKDYTAPAYWVNTVEIGFDLDPAATRVSTRITLQSSRVGTFLCPRGQLTPSPHHSPLATSGAMLTLA
ncbi:hypothetical protein [Candidatus Nitrotoga sp. HW29]|uniref:hypothetical protein n=1 Tax=Candidatus Nitrotoga sp. HW29 TaxID=2886963 RepID=UPI001EF30DB9|nr:hypothetical protein [Candidatus Nitrotoga sp. HW29]